MSISAEEKNRYLRETAIVLAREGFHTDRTHADGLCVLLDGAPPCKVTENGGITYRNEDMQRANTSGSHRSRTRSSLQTPKMQTRGISARTPSSSSAIRQSPAHGATHTAEALRQGK